MAACLRAGNSWQALPDWAASPVVRTGQGCRSIGVIPKGTNHTFWQSVHAGAIKAGQEFALDIEWNAPQMEIDAARQIAIVENFITRQADGIVLAPVRTPKR